MVPLFLYLNRYRIWTKFAQVTQEVIMDTQVTTVVMELGVRLMTMCLPSAHITKVVDHLQEWKLFVAQVSLPLIIATPLYCIFNFQYGVKGTNVPVLLSAPDVRYDASTFIIGLVYGVTAVVLCLGGYVYMFDTIRRKGFVKDCSQLPHTFARIFLTRGEGRSYQLTVANTAASLASAPPPSADRFGTVI
ncbi:unnamed protein product [Haemonchus placei]|uniref:Aa_trans domain-containing protein n=1 Tax=Haemonchus placei TaxID=6290 RepID=A0A0N4WWN5_HAEPC|nr:unnamed protein product [Haemonchus placei]